MANLTVIRPPEGIHDERKFKVLINGELNATLKQKSSVAIEVPEEPFEIQVISRQGRSRKEKIDPAATTTIELRINKRMHKYNPAVYASPLFTLSGLLLFNSDSRLVKAGAASLFLIAMGWIGYMLWVRREDWIIVVPA
jgi:hypothetical protein